jgi:hypothetical protein
MRSIAEESNCPLGQSFEPCRPVGAIELPIASISQPAGIDGALYFGHSAKTGLRDRRGVAAARRRSTDICRDFSVRSSRALPHAGPAARPAFSVSPPWKNVMRFYGIFAERHLDECLGDVCERTLLTTCAAHHGPRDVLSHV